MDEEIKKLLSDPNALLMKKPFVRGGKCVVQKRNAPNVQITDECPVSLPVYKSKVITQDQYLSEYFPDRHIILFNKSIPSIYTKVQTDGEDGFVEIMATKIALADQKNIHNKRMQHLTGNPTSFTLLDPNVKEEDEDKFSEFKSRWILGDFDNHRDLLISRQLCVGDAAILVKMVNGKVTPQILSYREGYIIIPHYNSVGEEILTSIYYNVDNIEYIDNYDDKYMTRMFKDPNLQGNTESGWVMESPKEHHFKQIPIVYHRGYVAWEFAQSAIETRELIKNINVIVKSKHGWGKLYIKGKVSPKLRTALGTAILEDTGREGGDAKYLSPPSGEAIKDLEIQLKKDVAQAASVTFLDATDINISGTISSLALKVLLSKDLEIANQSAKGYALSMKKYQQLVAYGFSLEDKISEDKARRERPLNYFTALPIKTTIKPWMPESNAAFNKMLVDSGDTLSNQTKTELNTEANPAELQRIKREKEALKKDQIKDEQRRAATNLASAKAQSEINNTNNKTEE